MSHIERVEYDLAIKAVASTRSDPARSWAVGYVEGLVEEARGRPNLAAKAYETVVAHAGPDPRTAAEARRGLARSYLRLGRDDDASRILEPLTSGSGRDEEAWWLLSRVRLRQGRLQDATAAAARAGDYATDSGYRPEPSPYTGEKACAKCHRRAHSAHAGSAHARTLFMETDLDAKVLPAATVPDPKLPGVTHAFARTTDGKVTAETRKDREIYNGLVKYALGSGHPGRSYLATSPTGELFELRLSLFGERGAEAHRWGKTAGHPDFPPERSGMFGRKLTRDEWYGCLACHATTARAADERTGPEAADRSIGCEQCHGPGDNHVRAVALRWDDLAMGRPKTATADQVVKMCGFCHDSPKAAPETTVTVDPLLAMGGASTASGDSRLQSRSLPRSACYVKSEGGLDCLTCHDPHRDAVRDKAYYEAKCLSCHSVPPEKPCPVNPRTDCVSCHMARDDKSMPNSVFTDHHIRRRVGK